MSEDVILKRRLSLAGRVHKVILNERRGFTNVQQLTQAKKDKTPHYLSIVRELTGGRCFS